MFISETSSVNNTFPKPEPETLNLELGTCLALRTGERYFVLTGNLLFFQPTIVQRNVTTYCNRNLNEFMKKIFFTLMLLSAVLAKAQTFEGTIKWTFQSEITDPAEKKRME